VTSDRSAFVTEAVRGLLSQSAEPLIQHEIDRINGVADDLNREAADVLEF
jgi:hypothetical protein